MKKNRKLAAVGMTLGILAVMLAGCGQKETAEAEPANRLEKILAEGKITNVCEPYFAPYEFIDNTKSGQEQFRGADMELARYIAKELGVELEIVPLEWSAVLTGVTEGKYDMAVAGLGYSEERAENMELSDIYKPGSEQGLLVRKEDLSLYNSLEDFAGKRVGFQSGTIQEQMATGQLPDSELVTFDIVQNAVLALDSKKIDAVAVSVPNGEMFAAANPNLAVTSVMFEQGKSGNCIAVPKGETELKERLNEIIAQVIEEGLYDQWMEEATKEAEVLGLVEE